MIRSNANDRHIIQKFLIFFFNCRFHHIYSMKNMQGRNLMTLAVLDNPLLIQIKIVRLINKLIGRS